MIDYVFAVTFLLIVLWIYTSRENENVYLKQLIAKVLIYYDSLLFMIISKDSKGVGPKHNPDPDQITQEQYLKKKKIIFVQNYSTLNFSTKLNSGLNISAV